jgi:hypothetical protein
VVGLQRLHAPAVAEPVKTNITKLHVMTNGKKLCSDFNFHSYKMVDIANACTTIEFNYYFD